MFASTRTQISPARQCVVPGNASCRIPKRLRLAPCAALQTADKKKEKPAAPSTDEYDPSYDGPERVPLRSTGRVVLETADELKSTWEQRAWVGGTIAMLATTLAVGASHVDNPADVLVSAGALYAAWSLADLGSGIYHWGVDNYGDGDTPVFGSQIAAFQGHHKRPWTITEREFCNNVHKVFQPAAYPAALLMVASPFAPSAWSIWSSSFLFLVCMSQQFHAWSHMKRSNLHPAVAAAQEAGLLINRKDHGAHHKPPFEDNYCIVSGQWNKLLDSSGVFGKAERFIFKQWGVEPRSWSDPNDEWTEEQRAAA